MPGTSQQPTKKRAKVKKAPEPIKLELPAHVLFRRLPVDCRLTDDRKVDIARPADFSFNHYTELKETGAEYASTGRQGKGIMGSQGKILSRSLWLNNNSIGNLSKIDVMAGSVLEYPERLGYLDLSYNEIEEVGDDLLKFKNLVVLYLHGNKINHIRDMYKLRSLKKLHSLTMFGNPLYDDSSLGNIRTVIAYIIPQLKKLDYNRLVGIEKECPVAGKVSKFVKYKGNVPERKSKKPLEPPANEEPKKAVEDAKIKKTMDEKQPGMPNVQVRCYVCPTTKCSCN